MSSWRLSPLIGGAPTKRSGAVIPHMDDMYAHRHGFPEKAGRGNTHDARRVFPALSAQRQIGRRGHGIERYRCLSGRTLPDLRTKSALAKSALSDVNASIREQAGAFAELSDEARGPALAALQALTAEQKELQASVNKTAAELKKASAAAHEHGGALSHLHEQVKLTGEGFEHLSATNRCVVGRGQRDRRVRVGRPWPGARAGDREQVD